MSPGQTRALFGAFLAVGVGVTFNALLLQPQAEPAVASGVGRKPAPPVLADQTPAIALTTPVEASVLARSAAPRAGDWARVDLAARRNGVEAVATQVAALPPDQTIRVGQMVLNAAKSDAMPHAPDADGEPATVRGVQRELQMRGYGPLVENGQAGPLTRAAIMAFEYDRQLALTGEATETLLRRILLDDAPAVPDVSSRKIKTPEAERVVRTVQHSLTTLGYQPGRIDGRVGEETERTIRAFEAEHGLAVTGRISAELFSRLARAVGAKSAAAR
jgi:peptidoglycan hydrolase-like protein with peptidoglycan-binding domain